VSTPLTEDLVREYAPRVYNLARRILSSDSDAEDVTQDVLMTVVKKLPQFRGESAIGTWLHRITVNAALAYRRKRARRSETEQASNEPLDEFADTGSHAGPIRPWSGTPDADMLNRETQELIERAIAQLPEAYRDVYVLADVEGLPNAEIAEMLGLNVPGVKSKLHRARLLMRKALAPHFEEVTP
jgi:RNA polymerase sigma-70 factor (ECF subfamily)